MKSPNRKKRMTLDRLAAMVARGFNDMATAEQLAEIKRDTEKIWLRLDYAVYKFDFDQLKGRVDVLEKKTGIQKLT